MAVHSFGEGANQPDHMPFNELGINESWLTITLVYIHVWMQLGDANIYPVQAVKVKCFHDSGS